MKIKDSFVRWQQNDKAETIGARFANADTAKTVCAQIMEIINGGERSCIIFSLNLLRSLFSVNFAVFLDLPLVFLSTPISDLL